MQPKAPSRANSTTDWLCWGVLQMELEVSHDEICCEDGQVERRTGAPDYIDGEGEAVFNWYVSELSRFPPWSDNHDCENHELQI